MPAEGWVIDDADAAPEPRALLHAMNAAREARLPLLLAARAQGLAAVTGIGMLLHQARPGFAAWFGVEPVVDAALEAAVLG